jgi:hypothetical protein
MTVSFFQLEVEGKPALGFDTGLDAQAFAQAKMAQFITQPGLAIFPGGKTETWKAGGVIEGQRPEGTSSMVIWGPPFPGERLDLLIEDDTRRDEALRALRHWLEAVLVSGEEEAPLRPGGAFVSPQGAVFFPPERLASRSLQAEGAEAWLRGSEAYVHPDLTGKAAAAFAAAAMLYRVFSGLRPFSGGSGETLHQNIREGVFLPVRLAAPGLDEKTAALIDAALEGGKKDQEGRLDPEPIRDRLRSAPEAASETAAGGVAAFFRPLPETERAKTAEEAARFWKKKNTLVHTRRFVIRNTAIIGGIAAAALFAVLIARSVIAGRAGLPTTAGMDSAQVVRSYYEAFGALDHQMMDAAVTGKAGKGDIEMVTNFFVISRVRQAYEYSSSPVIPAQEWRDSGSPPVNSQVFGVSDLDMEKISGGGDEIRYRVSYILWLPASFAGAGPESADPPPEETPPPLPYPYTDELVLIRHKGNWRIAEISRTTAGKA